jgi:hypothetical protein
MPLKRALLLATLCASMGLAADPPELKPLKGEKIKGDLVGLNTKEIVLQINGKPVTTPVEGTLQLDFRAPANPSGSYSQVELTDGSVLRCTKVEFKGKDVLLTLVSGQSATIPMTLLSSVMHEADDVKLVAAWKDLLGGKKHAYDVLVFKRQSGALGSSEGTFYDASDDGKTIDFKRKDKEKEPLATDRIHGMLFVRPPDPNMPGRLCEALDLQGNRLFARSVVLKDGKFVVDTQCGAHVEYPADALARLDYSKGKLTYLSDMELSKIKLVQVAYLQSGVPEFKRDRNIDNTSEIRIAGTKHPKGLAMHARTELTIDLEGEYREFKAVAGLDDNVSQGDDAPVLLRVEGDGKELLALSVTRKDGAKPISLNIKDVQKLRIVVDKSPDSLGLGSYLDLGDAKVSK